jgi:hypothetical protein
MKTILRVCAGLSCVVSLTAALSPPPTAPNFGPRFRQTRERADVLLGHRDGSYPVPDPRANLFQAPAEASLATQTANTPDPEPAGSDETLLADAVNALKASRGGFVSLNGIAYLSVGTQRYREGDSLSVPLRSGIIEIRVISIGSKSAILRLNDVEATLRF